MRMLSNTEAELKKRVSYKKSKKACNKVTMPSIVGHAYINIYIYIYIYMINTIKNNYMSCMKTKNIRIGKNNANI